MAHRIRPHIAIAMCDGELDHMCVASKDSHVQFEESLCYKQIVHESEQQKRKQIELCWEEEERTYMVGASHQDSTNPTEKKAKEERENLKPVISNSMRAKRRRQTAMKKRKLRYNAVVAMQNFCKRDYEDMMNGHFCKYRAGRMVKWPKSMGFKAIRLWRRASKQKLVSKEGVYN